MSTSVVRLQLVYSCTIFPYRQLLQAPSVDDQGRDTDVSSQEQQEEVRVILQLMSMHVSLQVVQWTLQLSTTLSCP